MLKRLLPEAVVLVLVVAAVATATLVNESKSTAYEAPQTAIASVPEETPTVAEKTQFASIAQAAASDRQALPVGPMAAIAAVPDDKDVTIANLQSLVANLKQQNADLKTQIDLLRTQIATALPPTPATPAAPVVAPQPAAGQPIYYVQAGGCAQALQASACAQQVSACVGQNNASTDDGGGWYLGKNIKRFFAGRRGASACGN
jgi:hypothetical protein